MLRLVIDVLETGTAMLRRLCQRLHHKVPHLEGGRMRHAMC